MNVLNLVTLFLLTTTNLEKYPTDFDNLPRVERKQDSYYSLLSIVWSRHEKLTTDQQEEWKFINEEFARINDDARHLELKKQYDDAVAKYGELLQYEPLLVQPYISMGDVRYREGKIEQSIDFYEQAVQQMKGTPVPTLPTGVALMRLGDMQARRGNYKEAIANYRQIVYSVKAHDWILPNGSSVRAKVPIRSIHPGGVAQSDEPDVLARYALYLSKAGQRDEAFYIYDLGLKILRLMNDNSTSSPSEYNIIDDTNIEWADALRLPKDVDARTFEAACYTMISLTIGESSWIDETGKLRQHDKESILVAAQKAVSLAPDFAPGQFVLGLAYEKCAATVPDAKTKAQVAYAKAVAGSNPSVAAAAKEAIARAK